MDIELYLFVGKNSRKRGRVLQLTLLLCGLLFWEIFAIFIFPSSHWYQFGYLNSVLQKHAMSFLIWMVASTLQTLLLVLILYHESLREILRQRESRGKLLFFIVLISTAFHWTILIFRLPVFNQIPGWFWMFRPKELNSRYALLAVLVILSVTVSYFVVSKFLSNTIKLALLIVFGYVFQLGFGFIRGGGFETLRLKYVSSGTSAIAAQACKNPDLLQTISQYNVKFGESSWEGTKPPGLMSFYIITQELVDFITPSNSSEECFFNLTNFAAYFFPLISMLVLIPLYGISRIFFREEDAMVPGLFYIVAPNVHIFPLYQDQFLYPLIFTLLIFMILRNGILRSFQLAVITGVGIYIAIFLSFSLLPIIGFAALWIGISVGLQDNRVNLGAIFKLYSGIFFGFALFTFLFYQFLDYNPFLRYEEAMTLHRTLKHFEPGSKEILQAILLNNTEFAALTGFSLFILFFTCTSRSIWQITRKQFNQTSKFVFAFGAMYAILNTMGQTKGEVGRIWLFLVPAFTLISSSEIFDQFQQQKNRAIILCVILLLGTSILTFLFQDYGCRLCR